MYTYTVRKTTSSSKVIEPFNEFLKTLKRPAAQDIVDHLKRYNMYTVTCASLIEKVWWHRRSLGSAAHECNNK